MLVRRSRDNSELFPLGIAAQPRTFPETETEKKRERKPKKERQTPQIYVLSAFSISSSEL
jgi:hypothetical protein